MAIRYDTQYFQCVLFADVPLDLRFVCFRIPEHPAQSFKHIAKARMLIPFRLGGKIIDNQNRIRTEDLLDQFVPVRGYTGQFFDPMKKTFIRLENGMKVIVCQQLLIALVEKGAMGILVC